MGEWEDPYNIIGFVGGVVLGKCVLAAMFAAMRRRLFHLIYSRPRLLYFEKQIQAQKYYPFEI